MDREVLHKILAETASETEKKDFEKWLHLSQDNRAEFNNIKLLLLEVTNEPDLLPDENFTEGLTKIKNRMRSMQKNKKTRWITKASFILAPLLVILSVILALHENSSPRKYLTFNHASLAEIIEVLEKEYDVSIVIDDPTLWTCDFTGTMYRSNTAKKATEILSDALSLQLEVIDERRFRIKGRGC